MKLEFTVKRNRLSVTQGSATVYLNGQEFITFGDKIELIKDGQAFYGDNIGGWASVTPDEIFIKVVLFEFPYDDYDRYAKKIKKILFNK